MGSFNKLYNKNYKASKKTDQNNWNNHWSDIHDYWDAIDQGYLTYEQFVNYNYCRDLFKNKLNDDEIYSMANSNEF